MFLANTDKKFLNFTAKNLNNNNLKKFFYYLNKKRF